MAWRKNDPNLTNDPTYLEPKITEIEAKLGKSTRQTQTLQNGANIIEGEVGSPATFEIEGKTLVSLGNSMLQANKHYVLADKNTKVSVDGVWKQGVAKFQKAADERPTFSRIATYEGKVSGSTVENPHVAKSGISTTLKTPSESWSELVSHYAYVSKLDGSLSSTSVNTPGGIAQIMFSKNIIAEIERKLGVIPKQTLADKVQWCKDNIAKITGNWWGYGSSPTGNKANIVGWAATTTAWVGAPGSHTSATVTKLSCPLPPTSYLGADGFIHFLTYAEPSDGVTASTINTDFFSCEIELKPGAELWHPNVPLYEVTSDEYNKILVDWTEVDVLNRYPRTQGVQHVQNPYVMAKGENLFDGVTGWSLASNVEVSPYALKQTTVGTSISYIRMPVTENTDYAVTVKKANAHGRMGAFTDNAQVIPNTTYETGETLTFNSGANKYVRIYFRETDTENLFDFQNIMISLGLPKPFVPSNPSYLYAETKLGSIADKKDTLFFEGGAYKKRKVIENVTLDGSLAWGYFDDSTGYKRVSVPNFSGLAQNSINLLVMKYSGKSLKPVLTSGMLSSDTFSVGSVNSLIALSDADTGFGETFTPTADDIKRYFNGWKYVDGVTWNSVTGNGQTATASTSLSTKPSDYTPYKLSYVLANPVTEEVESEGNITVSGKTQVKVGSGFSYTVDANTGQRAYTLTPNSQRYLFTSNPVDVEATYSKNLRDAHDDLVKRFEDVATQVSIDKNALIELYVRVKALEGGA
jgi:hypothetical protein